MCCRYHLDREHLKQVLARLGVTAPPTDALPRTRYNIPPGAPIPVIRSVRATPTASPPVPPGSADFPTSAAPALEFTWLHWGLIPTWAKDRSAFGAKLANARAETLAEKPSFRTLLRAHRCAIPASGFYEWQRLGRDRQAYHFTRRDGQPFCFAALWTTWRDPANPDPDAPPLESCTLITTSPNDLLRPIHDRMPVMFDPTTARAWLDPTTPNPTDLLRPFPADAMTATTVSPRVNSIAHDDPACLTPTIPAAPAPPQLDLDL